MERILSGEILSGENTEWREYWVERVLSGENTEWRKYEWREYEWREY